MTRRSAAAGSRGPFTFASLMLGHGAQGLAFTAFTPALAAIARDYGGAGHGALIAQLSVTIASAGVIAGALASGWIIARLGARATMLACLAIYGVAGAGGMALSDATLLLASRTVLGFATACLVTACIATIAARYEPEARGKAVGASSGVGSAVALGGLVIGGALAERFGWRSAFAQYPVFAAVGLLLALFAFPAVSARAEEPRLAARGAEAGAWSLWPTYLLTTFLAAVMFIGSTQFPFMIGADGIHNTGAIGLIMSGVTLTAVLVSFLYGAIERRLGLQGTLALGLFAMAAAMTLIGLVRTPAGAIAGAMLQGVYVGVTQPYIHHVVTLRAAASARARAVGLLNASNFLGALLNPLVFAPVIAWVGIQGLFVVVGVGMVAPALAALALGARGGRLAPAE
jgi:MFS family permease